MGKFTDVDATNIYCKNLYVYEGEYANAIATQKWVADKINSAIKLLAGMISSAQSTGNKAYGAAKHHSHGLTSTDAGSGKINIKLSGTTGGWTINNSDGTITGATKFGGSFGISTLSDSISNTFEPGDSWIAIRQSDKKVLIGPLYIVAVYSDVENQTQAYRASSAL